MIVYHAQRHLFNEGEIQLACQGEIHQVEYFVVVARMDKLTSKFQVALADAQSLAVGRDHQLCEARQRPELFDQMHDIVPHQRFAPGKADFAHAKRGECLRHAVQLLKTQYLRARHEDHVLGHAVDAAEIAAIRDRETHIIDGASESVHQSGVIIAHSRRFYWE